MPRVPLSVLDLSPVPAGGTAADGLSRTIDLARQVEALGYRRFWVAEHHLAPGVASSAPGVLIGLVAAATSSIRVGSGAVLTGHQTPLAVVEQFGTVDALHPGRLDLGLGRSGRPRTKGTSKKQTPTENRVVDGLLIPPPFPVGEIVKSPRFRVQQALLQQPEAQTPDFPEIVDAFHALLAGTYEPQGVRVHASPGEGADVELWVLGSSGGESARVAGERGLPFGANYHVAPSGVLDAVETYRDAFRPGVLDEPRVIVSADVLVAETDSRATELGEPFGLWVRSIRTAEGAIPYPTPEDAAKHEWTPQDRALVQDRLDTRFVGSPTTVVRQLETLQRVTGADELLITTNTYAHEDRVASYRLLREAWAA